MYSSANTSCVLESNLTDFVRQFYNDLDHDEEDLDVTLDVKMNCFCYLHCMGSRLGLVSGKYNDSI